MGGATLTICTTCRRICGGTSDSGSSEPGEERPGARLFAALAARDLPPGVTLRPVECLSACAHGCTAAFSGGPERWRYIYGNLDPSRDIDALLDGIARYAATPDGLVPWRARPPLLRRNVIARLPPEA